MIPLRIPVMIAPVRRLRQKQHRLSTIPEYWSLSPGAAVEVATPAVVILLGVEVMLKVTKKSCNKLLGQEN